MRSDATLRALSSRLRPLLVEMRSRHYELPEVYVLERLARVGVAPAQLIERCRALCATSLEDELDPDLLVLLAQLLAYSLREPIVALRVLAAALAIDPGISEVYRQLNDLYPYAPDLVRDVVDPARLCEHLRSETDALGVLESGRSCIELGMLLQRLGDLDTAERVYRALVVSRDLDPEQVAEARYGLEEIGFLRSAPRSAPPSDRAAGAVPGGRPRLVVASIFFGAEYRELFEQVSGASALCGANLAPLEERWDVELLVLCPALDAWSFSCSDLHERLSGRIRVRCVRIPHRLSDAFPLPAPQGAPHHPSFPYRLMGLAQAYALQYARSRDAALLNLPADAVFSSSLAEVVRSRIDRGAEVVFCAGIRLRRESVRERLTEWCSDHGLEIDTASLTRVALRELHPATHALIANEGSVTYPGMLWWRQGEETLAGHCFQMHPLYLSRAIVSRWILRRFESVDGSMVDGLLRPGADRSSVHVLTESCEAVMFELSDGAVRAPRRFSIRDVPEAASAWLIRTMRPLHYWLFTHQVTIGDPDPGVSTELREEIERICSEVRIACARLTDRMNDPAEPWTREAAVSERKPVPDEWPTRRGLADQTGQPCFPASVDQLRVLFTVAVWGAHYVDQLLALTLPTLSSTGNLKGLPCLDRSILVIYTRSADLRRLRSDPRFEELHKLMRVDVELLPEGEVSDKYALLNLAQSMALQRALEYDVFVPLYGDFVLATNALRNTLEQLCRGSDVVVCAVPPLVRERFIDELDRRRGVDAVADQTLQPIELAPRELAGMTKALMHPLMRTNQVDAAQNMEDPAYVLWEGPGGDLLIRCFHIHPVAMRVLADRSEFREPLKGTLDEEFFPRVFSSMHRVYCVRDSDEVLIVSLTPSTFNVRYLQHGHRFSVDYVARWAESAAAPVQRELFGAAYLLHEHDIDAAEWASTVRASRAFADAVRRRLALPDAVLSHSDPLAWRARKHRSDRLRASGRVVSVPLGLRLETGLLWTELLVRAVARVKPWVRRLRRIPGLAPSSAAAATRVAPGGTGHASEPSDASPDAWSGAWSGASSVASRERRVGRRITDGLRRAALLMPVRARRAARGTAPRDLKVWLLVLRTAALRKLGARHSVPARDLVSSLSAGDCVYALAFERAREIRRRVRRWLRSRAR